MLTASQIAAVIMLLKAFGVSPAVVTNVQDDLTHTATTQQASQTGGVLSPDNIGTVGAPGFGTATVTAGQLLSCSVSLSVVREDGKNPFVLVAWDFPEGAVGVLTSPVPLRFYGTPTPVKTPLAAHSYNVGKVGYYTSADSTSVSLAVTEDGYAPANCSQGLAL